MTFFRTLVLSLSLVFGVGFVAQAQEPGDAERGKKVFRKCAGCHMLGEKAKNRAGPPLNDILSAKAALNLDFKYSKSMRRASEDGLHWTPETLDLFIQSPKAFIPGTKMNFRGLKVEKNRADLIAYLSLFSGGELAVRVEADFEVSPEILAIEGDIEYGEYLSSECTTCHRTDGNNDGIPSIVGWETEAFVHAMHAYREKHRENPVMQLVTGRLSDDEIAALAAYFNGLEN